MNEEVLTKLANVNTVEELNAILAENNIQLEDGVTPEAFLEALKGGNDELDAKDLDEVAGGFLRLSYAQILAAYRLGISIALYLKRYYRWH